MCGIAAIVGFTEAGKQQLTRIAQCPVLLRHRGPDKQQHLIEENFGFAHARLSIIDLSPQSDQPFTSHDKRFTLVYNGEIFNYRELREELQQRGITFHTDGDAEVLINLYRAYGREGIQKINGFFAFVLHDRQSKTFFAARDRFGVKPLYYYHSEDIFACASELRSLRALANERTIDKAALFAYLQLTYTPENCTLLKNMHKLAPGASLFIENGGLSFEQYYSLSLPAQYSDLSEPSASLLELLDSAVQLRMVSDVPVASFLSGGIDSSVITALASRYNPGLQTFSLGFRGNAQLDESKFAGLVARKYNTKHHTFYLTDPEAEAEIGNFLDAMDEPFADSSAFNVYMLSKMTRRHVKVVLSGDGADELFAGYNKHRAEWMVRNQPAKTALLGAAAGLARLLPASREGKLANRVRQLDRFAKGAKLDAGERYWRWASFYSETLAARLLRPDASGQQSFQKRKQAYTSLLNEDFNSVLLADARLVLPGDMLVKVDRMSMAHGLEVRNPFLDYRVVEFAFSLHAKHKLDARQQKKIVRESFRHLLPDEILNRSKHGFETPVRRWLRGVLRPYVEELLLNPSFIEQQGLFEYEELNRVVQKALSQDAGDSAAVVWALLIFNHWYKKHLS
jgi:asparagine synthase (glutamine-hydrolysing)